MKAEMCDDAGGLQGFLSVSGWEALALPGLSVHGRLHCRLRLRLLYVERTGERAWECRGDMWSQRYFPVPTAELQPVPSPSRRDVRRRVVRSWSGRSGRGSLV